MVICEGFKSISFSVNMDLDSDQRVLPNAPLAGYDEDFSTYGMKAFDRVSLVFNQQTINRFFNNHLFPKMLLALNPIKPTFILGSAFFLPHGLPSPPH